jgi:hypothetical protein
MKNNEAWALYMRLISVAWMDTDQRHLKGPTDSSTLMPDKQNCFQNNVFLMHSQMKNVQNVYLDVGSTKPFINKCSCIYLCKILLQMVTISNVLTSVTELLKHVYTIINL